LGPTKRRRKKGTGPGLKTKKDRASDSRPEKGTRGGPLWAKNVSSCQEDRLENRKGKRKFEKREGYKKEAKKKPVVGASIEKLLR